MTQIVSVLPANGSVTLPRSTFTVNISYDAGEYRWHKVAITAVLPSVRVVQVYSAFFVMHNNGNYTVNLIFPGDFEDGNWVYFAGLLYYPTQNGTGTSVHYLSDINFTVVSTPSVTLESPADNTWVGYENSEGSTKSIPVSWKFGANGTQATQSAYQIQVIKTSDGSSVYDSGKVVSALESANIVIPITTRGFGLQWRVRVWNNIDKPSVYSGYRNITAVLPPTISITSPLEAAVLTSGVINIESSGVVLAPREIARRHFSLWNGSQKLWEGYQALNNDTGTTATFTTGNFVIPQGSLQYRAYSVDTNGVSSTEIVRNFSTSFPIPADTSSSVVVNSADYNTQGYVSVSWSDLDRDANFFAWQVERAHIELDPGTGTLSEMSEWEVAGRVLIPTSNYTFKDYLAPGSHLVFYRVKQVALQFGVERLSLSGRMGNSVVTSSDSYWIVSGINGDSATMSAIRLYNVTGDTYTDETVVSEFNIMGRGRYVDQGDRLGIKGQLDLKLRDSNGLSARAKRKALLDFRNNNKIASLRTPFGDTYKVSVMDIGVSRLAGTGRAEFCDVTVPYIEVVR